MPEMIERRRNRATWIALVLAVAALLSNGIFFLHLPGERIIPFLGWALLIAAVVCAVVGMLRAFRQPQVYSGKVSASIFGVLSLLICAFTAFGAIHSRDLPVSTEAPQVGQKAPDFTLADSNGAKVSLEQLLGKAAPSSSTKDGSASAVAPKAVLLIFYRGYW